MKAIKEKKCGAPVFLGIDTSNYKTSCAVVDFDGNILFNHQGFLDVKHGERGLRQSDAFFQHVNKLPDIIEQALSDDIRERIAAVSVSTRPRPVEGSYMPVFNAGYSAARNIATALNVPIYCFSHQEGHIEAIRYYCDMKDEDPVVCFHFSGGTTEAVLVDIKESKFELIGGSRDLAYGQVLDRIGVALGYAFPAGQELDKAALEYKTALSENEIGEIDKFNDPIYKNPLTKIKVIDGWVNLSGIETQAQRLITALEIKSDNDPAETADILSEIKTSDMSTYKNKLMYDVMLRTAQSITEMTEQISKKYDINSFIYAGGVSSSKFVREYVKDYFSGKKEAGKINITFGDPMLSTDNAIGIALLGMEAYGSENI